MTKKQSRNMPGLGTNSLIIQKSTKLGIIRKTQGLVSLKSRPFRYSREFTQFFFKPLSPMSSFQNHETLSYREPMIL